MNIVNKNGYWEGKGVEVTGEHHYDSFFGDSLCDFFLNENIKSLVDFGCGMGDYLKKFKQNNINAIGFDGNPYTPYLTNNLGQVLDLSLPKYFDEQFDWVLSIEVGEHLPSEFEDIFINNLHNNNKYGIVLSWAVKGQGGLGHFNEQNNDYIKNKICKLGYINDIKSEIKLRKYARLPWLKNTIMVFRKIGIFT